MADQDGVQASLDKLDVLVVGAGPAGLMAADDLSRAGRRVVIADAMPSVGRKFLMAGKSGLNLTKSEPPDRFLHAFGDMPPQMREALGSFGPDDVVAWAEALGIPVFAGSTGRVFPKVMKASPLLRAWLARLRGQGVDIRTRWRWTGWQGQAWTFETPAGPVTVDAAQTVLALGGASWQRLGSDGRWRGVLAAASIATAPFLPANMGFAVGWSAPMARHYGTPVKSSRLVAGDLSSRGEWVVSARGIEGGAIYEVSRAVRDGHPLILDLAPDLTAEDVGARLSRTRGKASLSNHLRKTLGLSPVARALLFEWGRPLPDDPDAMAGRIKALEVRHAGPLPLDGAISTAGGVAWRALDGFRLRARPDTYVAGEMLDWEAPTGGYLITGCLATGRAAARQAIADASE